MSDYGVTGLVSCRLWIELKWDGRSYDMKKDTLSANNIALVFGVRILDNTAPKMV